MKEGISKVKNIDSTELEYGEIEVLNNGRLNHGGFTVKIKTNDYPGDVENLILYEKIQIPETLKEFREVHNLSKEELVNWLNENYGKSV